MKIFTRLFIILFFAVLFPASAYAEKPTKVTLETRDGTLLVSNYLKVPDSKAVVILLPMLSKTKASWQDFQGKLAANNFSSIAVDLRGHGESTSQKGREISWRTFSNKSLSKIGLDIEAVYEFLIRNEKISASKIFIAGASIGANLALNFAADHAVAGILLLSPGLDYRGITTEEAAGRYGDKPVFYAASREDMSSFESMRLLARLAPRRRALSELENAGHGTEMLQNSPFLADQMIDFLKECTGTKDEGLDSQKTEGSLT
jgi:pimeloyl-ACP methyl ester carboxylesterase